MTYNDLIQSFKQYRPETDKNKGRLSDARISEIVSNTLHSALPKHEHEHELITSCLCKHGNDAPGMAKEIIQSWKPQNVITSALPSKEATDYNMAGLTLSP